jgi:hypothetical protein
VALRPFPSATHHAMPNLSSSTPDSYSAPFSMERHRRSTTGTYSPSGTCGWLNISRGSTRHFKSNFAARCPRPPVRARVSPRFSARARTRGGRASGTFSCLPYRMRSKITCTCPAVGYGEQKQKQKTMTYPPGYSAVLVRRRRAPRISLQPQGVHGVPVLPAHRHRQRAQPVPELGERADGVSLRYTII